MTLDFSSIAQTAVAAGLIGIVAAVWTATVALARLAARFDEHKEQDAREFARIDADVREAQEVARAALYGERND